MGNKTPTIPPQVQLFISLHRDFTSLMEKGMAAEERMHSASLEAQQGLLTTALKGAENVSPEAFAVLVTALKEVSLASIEAKKEVSLASIENGRAAVKMMDSALQAGIAAFAPVAVAQAEARGKRADADLLNATTRSKEAKVKAKNADSEARKAAALVSAKFKKDRLSA